MMESHGIYRVGDWVEVRPLEEILVTLDAKGGLDGLPFMPEMVRHCGRRFRVVKSAHKTCDPTGATEMRYMAEAVHLDTRCDGAFHDGCEARCRFIWKNAWLRPVSGPEDATATADQKDAVVSEQLLAATRVTREGQPTKYICQTTEIVPATTVMSEFDARFYLRDITTGNVSIGFFLREFGLVYAKAGALAFLKALGLRRGKAASHPPKLGDRDRLMLQPGEWVRVRSRGEILQTLNAERKNRGLSFEKEMFRHCGKEHRVVARVKKIIDEKSGRMLHLANDCVILDNVICNGRDYHKRLFCSRGTYTFWREAWLERINDNA